MKIGIEVQRLFRRKKFGIETSALELITAMRVAEPQHEYVVFAKNDVDRGCLLPSENLKIKLLGSKLFFDFEQFLLPLAARAERVDLLHCTGNTAPYFCPVPVVQTLHDVIFMDPIPSEDSLYQRFGNHYRRHLVPRVTPRSQAVITVSHYEKERIIKRLPDVNPDNVHVVYNGIDEARFNGHADLNTARRMREKYRLPEGYILFLGNLSTRKNPGRVIEAYVRYAASAEKPLALVTPGLSEPFVIQKLRELKYPYSRNHFITPGYIVEADLPWLYRLSKMFLFPSLSEGFGMPLVEAMACGAPVITSSVSCMPEIAGNAALLIDPYNAEEMADAIKSLSENEPLRLGLSNAGIQNARRFSWKQTAENVLSLYELVFRRAEVAQKVSRSFHAHQATG